MASGLSSPLGFTGIFFIIIGILMAIGGIVGLIIQANEAKAWWVWMLLIGGIVIGIIGGILLAIAMSRYTTVEPITYPAYVDQPQIITHQNISPQQYNNGVMATQHSIMPATVPNVVTAPTYVTPKPAQMSVPVGRRTYTMGQDHFNPDPQKVQTISNPSPRRVVATGPYGPNGQQMQVMGTLTPAKQVEEYTYDIADHPVNVNRSRPMYVNA